MTVLTVRRCALIRVDKTQIRCSFRDSRLYARDVRAYGRHDVVVVVIRRDEIRMRRADPEIDLYQVAEISIPT